MLDFCFNYTRHRLKLRLSLKLSVQNCRAITNWIKKLKMASTFFDHYALLGCDPRATAAEITKIYREKAKKLHPDKNLHNNLSAHEVFVKLVKAKEILTDKKKRATYDRQYRLYWRNKLQNKKAKNKEKKNKNKAQSKEKSNNNCSESESNDSNSNSDDSADGDVQGNEDNENKIEITDDLIELVVRGAYHKHGSNVGKISEELEKVLDGTKFTVVIMKNGCRWSSFTFNHVKVVIGNVLIHVFQKFNVDIVDRDKMKSWLDQQYGWVTGISQLKNFRDNLKEKIQNDFIEINHGYNILIYKQKNAAFNCKFSVYGVLWKAKDNQTVVVVCDH